MKRRRFKRVNAPRHAQKENATVSTHHPARSSPREVFIVRLWSKTRARPIGLGQVQHVRTGQVAYVRGLKELLAFFSSQMEQPDPALVKPKGLK
jgi:hypothetical protein